MFTRGSRQYFDALQSVFELEAAPARRLLSVAYTEVLARRLELASDHSDPDGSAENDGYLRRIVSALEVSLLHPRGPGESGKAAAFVAAESGYLLWELRTALPSSSTRESAGWCDSALFAGVEAALLYSIAEHDSNARIVAEEIRADLGDSDFESESARSFADALLAFFTLDAPIERRNDPLSPTLPLDTASRSAFFQLMAQVLDEQAAWLRMSSVGDDRSDLLELFTSLLFRVSSRHPDIGLVGRLVALAIASVKTRALRQLVDVADDEEGSFLLAYVRDRASERPLLWPPARDYVESCILGDVANAVVAVPTGSGKGFLAEVAVASALTRGWVAYLVPTNALASQVRQDMRAVFSFDPDVTVQAFFGGQEYTELEQESVVEVPSKSIIVMTPEKCALGLRRAPEAFENLELLVVDECHLMGDLGNRGVGTELVVAQILSEAPSAKAVFLSALLANPQDVADWIAAATGRTTQALASDWRPTRTLRGFLGYASEPLQVNATAASERLANRGASRRNEAFESPFRLLVGLQGAWDSHDTIDYATMDLPLAGPLRVSRRTADDEDHRLAKPSRWLNESAARLSHFAAGQGERVLTFLPRSRHDPFVVADEIGELPSDVDAATPKATRVRAHLTCAEYELGVESAVRERMGHGVAVHTSAMLDAEKNASESAFQSGLVPLIVATGTLAQGLNLPATVVVSAGTSLAGGRVIGGQERLRAQILNAMGRAGRAEYANHGVALVIPNDPLAISGPATAQDALSRARFLADEDTSVPVNSRLAAFLSRLESGDLAAMEALTLEEMTAISFLPLEDESPKRSDILGRTYGAFQAGFSMDEGAIRRASLGVSQTGRRYLEEAGLPLWTREVAYLAGLPLPATFAVFDALQHVMGADTWEEPVTTSAWIVAAVDVLKQMPPQASGSLLWSDALIGTQVRPPGGYTFSDYFNTGRRVPDEEWSVIESAIHLFIAGATIEEIARVTLDLGSDSVVNSSRRAGTQPIPKTLALIRDLTGRFSLLLGAIAASFAVGLEEDEQGPWDVSAECFRALQEAPVATRAGCGTPSSLAWFRFGLRYRRPAHLLASAFELPSDIESDAAASEWVRRRRRDWLSGDVVPAFGLSEEEAEVMSAIRTLLDRA